MRAWARGVLLAAAVPCALALPASAEEARGTRPFAEFGIASFQREESAAKQAGFRITSVTPGQPGVDFSLAAWVAPLAVLTPDLDITVPFALGPDARLVPRVGVSGLLFGGGDFVGAAAGANAGVGVIFNTRGRLSFRVDYTLRRINTAVEEPLTMHVLSIGIGPGAKDESPETGRRWHARPGH